MQALSEKTLRQKAVLVTSFTDSFCYCHQLLVVNLLPWPGRHIEWMNDAILDSHSPSLLVIWHHFIFEWGARKTETWRGINNSTVSFSRTIQTAARSRCNSPWVPQSPGLPGTPGAPPSPGRRETQVEFTVGTWCCLTKDLQTPAASVESHHISSIKKKNIAFISC